MIDQYFVCLLFICTIITISTTTKNQTKSQKCVRLFMVFFFPFSLVFWMLKIKLCHRNKNKTMGEWQKCSNDLRIYTKWWLIAHRPECIRLWNMIILRMWVTAHLLFVWFSSSFSLNDHNCGLGIDFNDSNFTTNANTVTSQAKFDISI